MTPEQVERFYVKGGCNSFYEIAAESEREKAEAVKELVEAAQELVNMIHEDMKSTGPFKITPSMAVKQALMGARALLSKHSTKGEGAKP